MESVLDPWQFEIFSSAELSPPSSPESSKCPSTPTLHSYVLNYDSGNSNVPSLNGSQEFQNTFASGLNDLEQSSLSERKDHDTDFGLEWRANTMHAELFDELMEFNLTPPSSPEDKDSAFSSVCTPQKETCFSKSEIPTVQPCSFDMLEQPSINVPYGTFFAEQSENITAIDQYNAEFNQILESLQHVEKTEPNTSGPTLIPREAEKTLLPALSNDPMESVIVEQRTSAQLIFDPIGTFVVNEADILDMQNSIISLESELSEASIEMDTSGQHHDKEVSTAEKILDALLQGDLQAAQSYASIQEPNSSDELVSLTVDAVAEGQAVLSIEPVTASTLLGSETLQPVQPAVIKEVLKPERRGRKPCEKSAFSHITNKSLRKKEQNKTAAIRYRQKKKMESMNTQQKLSELSEETSHLEKEKADLSRQINMVKQLLKDVINSKKRSNLKAVIASAPAPKRSRRKSPLRLKIIE